jgi:predicted methyltransferase
VPNTPSNRKPVFRIVLFLFCAILIFLGLNTLYSFTNTLRRLDAIESERDQWQRPSDILRALDLREGNTVADLGSGSGYFTLKLAPAVGKQGQVLAVDLRKLSLFFLWTRALLRGQHAVHVILGDEDDPRLPAGSMDAVLICNTYHEFSHPEVILTRVGQSLRAGGRLVIVDRAPRPAEVQHTHEVSLSAVETELRQMGFEIVSQDDHFIERPSDSQGDELWWLVIARKPQT